ncbi:MAG: aspartate/glutamate racemase family protein [Nitrospinota bacterium]
MPNKIAVIHAMRVAVAPVEEAFRRLWPEARTTSLLDESLARELAEAGRLTQGIMDRIAQHTRACRGQGAQAVLFSCSAFGAAIEAARQGMGIPVLKPNEAMLEEALERGRRIRLMATFEPSIPSMLKELREMAAQRGKEIQVDRCHVPGALEALESKNPELHDALIAEAARKAPPCDVILLAQFSMARALPLVSKWVDIQVLSSPESAVAKLRGLMASLNGNGHLPANGVPAAGVKKPS